MSLHHTIVGHGRLSSVKSPHLLFPPGNRHGRTTDAAGHFFALAAYFIWGIAPAYFKLIQQVPADEILTHRVIWSFFFMLGLVSLGRNWPQVRAACKNRKRLLLLAVTALLVGGTGCCLSGR